jgi:hypothetical protein
MKQVRVQQLVYDLLLEISKKRRTTPENLIEQLVLQEYKKK